MEMKLVGPPLSTACVFASKKGKGSNEPCTRDASLRFERTFEIFLDLVVMDRRGTLRVARQCDDTDPNVDVGVLELDVSLMFFFF